MTESFITQMAAPGAAVAPAPSAPPPEGDHSALELSTGATTLGEMILRAEGRNGAALRYKEAGSWHEIPYGELVRRARDIARGLIALGIKPGERVSILADTRPEWTIADAGSFCAATVVAPIPSVPRVWEKIYTAATTGVADQPRLKRSIFSWALGVGHRVRELERGGASPGRILAVQHHLADRLVLSKVRDLFGGRLELAVTAAAPIATDVLEFFDACGILLVEAWGMTETCAAGTINTDLEMKMGTIGKPVPTLEMRVAPDGELLARGANIFGGYFKDEQATKDTLTDGWLATGDLGEIDADGFVSITGRKKDLIITSSGKNITAANIENSLKQTRWISEAVAFGDRRPYLVALLTLDPDAAPKLAERLGIAPDISEMTRNEHVRAEIQKDVEAVNQHFARIEQIKRFAILGRELTQEDGELTPTLKVKRAVVYAKFADVFGGLYAD